MSNPRYVGRCGFPIFASICGVFSSEKPKPRFPNGLAHCDPSLSDTDQNFVPQDR